MQRITRYILYLINFSMISCNTVATQPDPLADKAMNELRTVLATQSQFIKVHAAEYLIWLGDAEEVKKEYLKEDSLYHTQTPYRIGIWRVLAEAEENPADKARWINKVFDVYGDPRAPDRLHATETLAKLQQSPLERYPDITRETLASDNRNLRTYALWAVSYASDTAMEKNRTEFLHLAATDPDSIIRKISAFILRKIKGLTTDEWTSLANRALAEPAASGMRHSLLNTVFVTLPEGAGNEELFRRTEQEMLKDHAHFSAAERIELALSLADKGTDSHLPILTSMLNNEHVTGIYEPNSKEGADVRATAAFAILKIKERAAQGS